MQYKPKFNAKYSGINSLQTAEETQTSVTSTLFLGARLWKGASLFFNHEIAGGSGLSSALGVASSTNGETFRVGSADPKLYVARVFFQQFFQLGKNKRNTLQEDEANQIATIVPEKYFAFTVGKICLADFFDDNSYSHDPRTQFMSWGLMDNGAWDYAANTRGYTPSVVLELISPRNELRYAFSMTPTVANGGVMNEKILQANANNIEFTHRYQWHQKQGAIRVLSFWNNADMGNYNQIVAQYPQSPDITLNEKYGRTKIGLLVNAEQQITSSLGAFIKVGWNDGKNETWHFTEIDNSASVGISLNGKKWKRNNDTYGAAIAISGISNAHQNYLKAGGKGFMLGDGNLNYGLEKFFETYYSLALNNHLFISAAYQFVVNPGYNIDRGPVNVFSVRFHTEF